MQRIEAMKWLQRLALLVVMAWSGLFGTPLRAQETAGPAAPKPMAWKGTEGGDAPANPKDLEKLAGELETELAKLKLALEVDGSTQELRDKLTKLWVASTYREEFPRRWDVLVRIVLVRAEELERRGELAAARAVATDLLPRPDLAKELSRLHPSFEFVQASPELIKGAEAARKDPRLVALCARLDAKLAKQPGLAYIGERAGNAGNPAQDENAAALLEDAVMRALLEQQPGMIRDLGARAAPALEQLVANDLDTLPPDASLDPLVLLFEVDEPRGAQFALEHWPKGGYLFHKRVLRAMEKANVLRNSGTWLAANPQQDERTFAPPKLVETAWRDVLVLAANDVEVRRDSLGLLEKLGEFDAFDAALQRTLSSWIERESANEAAGVLNMLLACHGRTSIVPIAESALGSSHGETRVLAARILERYARNDSLRTHARDPEPEVRMAVARSLEGNLLRPQYIVPQNLPGLIASTMMGGGSEEFRRSIEARDATCIETLLADSDPRVRELALKAFLQSAEVAVSTQRLVELAKDADPKVREKLAKWGRAEAMPAEVVKELAADPNFRVSDQATRELDRISRERQPTNDPRLPSLRWSDDYLPALQAAIVNPSGPGVGIEQAAWRAGQSAEGARLLVRLARASPSPRTFRLLLSATSNTRETFVWDAIGTEDLPALLRETFLSEWRQEPNSPNWRSNWAELIGTLPATHASAFRGLLLDAKLAPEIRVIAASASAATADAEWNRAFADVVEALPSDYWASGANELKAIHSRLETSMRKEALVQELAARKASADTLGTVIREITTTFRLPEPLALEVLGRECDRQRSPWLSVQVMALSSLSFSEAEPRLGLLEQCLRDGWLWGRATAEMAKYHLDAHLPLLERAVQGEFDVEGRYNVAQSAATVLAGYLDDRAAEILLRAVAATPDQGRRESLFKALDEIRRYQDERERWANRKSSKAARDAAIAELVPMLGDKDATIRAQAAKSLGALEALEQLPALVRLLKDSDTNVRKAAQSAIDVLTAPKPVPPAPEAPKSGAPAKKDE